MFHLKHLCTEDSYLQAGQTPCIDGLGCYAQTQRCDFYPDCGDSSDELGCPKDYYFDNCLELNNGPECQWEELSEDALDWVIATGGPRLVLKYLQFIFRKRHQ